MNNRLIDCALLDWDFTEEISDEEAEDIIRRNILHMTVARRADPNAGKPMLEDLVLIFDLGGPGDFALLRVVSLAVETKKPPYPLAYAEEVCWARATLAKSAAGILAEFVTFEEP